MPMEVDVRDYKNGEGEKMKREENDNIDCKKKRKGR